jgi:hypothetical protein
MLLNVINHPFECKFIGMVACPNGNIRSQFVVGNIFGDLVSEGFGIGLGV